MKIAVVGASGLVGQSLCKILADKLPNATLQLYGNKSVGTKVVLGSKRYTIMPTQEILQSPPDVAMFMANEDVARQFVLPLANMGVVCIDNSSHFRLHPNVPLVVPSINGDKVGKNKIIANPNCTTIIMAVCLKAIEELSHIRRVHVSSYQSASGAGASAMAELEEQYRQAVNNEEVTHNKFAYQLAYNLIPQIDVFGDDDYTKEELKMYHETRKIMHSDIAVSATCVRVPSLRAHSEAVWVETAEPLTPEQVREALSHAEGVQVMDDPSKSNGTFPYPMPLYLSGTDDVYVGRIRRDLANENGITFWCVGDQIRKGAALNAVQIAEKIIQK